MLIENPYATLYLMSVVKCELYVTYLETFDVSISITLITLTLTFRMNKGQIDIMCMPIESPYVTSRLIAIIMIVLSVAIL